MEGHGGIGEFVRVVELSQGNPELTLITPDEVIEEEKDPEVRSVMEAILNKSRGGVRGAVTHS